MSENLIYCPFQTTEYGPGTSTECTNQCALFDEDSGKCSLTFLKTIAAELYQLRTALTSDKRFKEEA